MTETIQRRWIIGLKDVSHPESQQVNFLLPEGLISALSDIYQATGWLILLGYKAAFI